MGLRIGYKSSEPPLTTDRGVTVTVMHEHKYQPPPTPEPDPRSFEILMEEVVLGRSILLVRYPGCTTFEGRKLLLLDSALQYTQFLDPHLLGYGNNRVIARFEPTFQGMELAKMCAEKLGNKS